MSPDLAAIFMFFPSLDFSSLWDNQGQFLRDIFSKSNINYNFETIPRNFTPDYFKLTRLLATKVNGILET